MWTAPRGFWETLGTEAAHSKQVDCDLQAEGVNLLLLLNMLMIPLMWIFC